MNKLVKIYIYICIGTVLVTNVLLSLNVKQTTPTPCTYTSMTVNAVKQGECYTLPIMSNLNGQYQNMTLDALLFREATKTVYNV